MKARSWKRMLAISLAACMAVPNTAALAAEKANPAVPEEQKSSEYSLMKDVVQQKKSDFNADVPKGEVEFIVELEGKSLLEQKPEKISLDRFLTTKKGEAAVNAITKEQATVEKSITKVRAAGMEIEYSYQAVLNGFSVKADYSAKEELENIPGVKNVYVAETHEYVEPVNGYTKAVRTSGSMMDSDRVNEEGYTGKGVVTAVLDTGAKVDHVAFAADPEDPRFSKDDIAGKITAENFQAKDVTADDVYKSGKIPYAYDYADQDSDVADSQGHGTHVAGSVGADCEEFSGVAPDTQLVIMKVFSDTSSGASDAWIFAALEDCVNLGVDAVNMSLGTACGFTKESVSDEVYQRVEAAGINLMCAAGNDTSATYNNLLGTNLALLSNPDSGIVGSPSTYPAAVSVASINEMNVYTAYFMAGDQKIKYNDTAESDDLKWISLDGQTLEYVRVPGFGTAEDFAQADVNGKIALVERGTIAFTEKEQNAKDAGAVALIVYDNVEGDLLNMQTGGLMPMIAITKADGKYLRELEDKKITISRDFFEDMPSEVGGQMSDFSSLGVTPDLSLKPEITAPGGNVYSSVMSGGFGNMSGTSMASPHMAGAAAVMRQYVKEAFADASLNEQQALVNELLMSTAVQVTDPDGVAYTPRKQGAGLAEIYNAVHTKAYLTVDGQTRTKAELKDSTDGSYSFTFRIHNFGTEPLSYDVSAVPLVAKTETAYGQECISESSRVLAAEEFQVAFSEDAVTVPAGETKDVTVTMALTADGKKNLEKFVNGIFLDGFIKLTSKNEDKIDLSLPYLGFYGDWADAPIFDATKYDDDDAFMYEGSMALIDNSTGDGYYLGMNMMDGSVDANKIAVASHVLGYERVYSMLGLLRAPKELTYTVTSDQDQTEVFSETVENAMKSFYYASGGFNVYDMGPSNGWAPIYVQDDNYYYLPDGDYTYTVTGRIDGKEETQSISFPISIDNQKPEVVSHQYAVEDGVPYLYVTVKDNNYVMCFQLIDVDGEEGLSDTVVVNEEKKGAETTYKFDLTRAQAAGFKLGRVAMYDFTLSYAESEVFSLVSQDIEPIEVKINQQGTTCSTSSRPWKLDALVYPDEAKDKSVTWSSDTPELASVTKDGVVIPLAPGDAVIRATACNGVSGTTTIHISETVKELPEDYVITEDGAYTLPENLNKTVTIKNTARKVTLYGNPANTAENPYTGLNIVSEDGGENGGLTLIIKDLNANLTGSKNILALEGTGNRLQLLGENHLKGTNVYGSKALIRVLEGTELTLGGPGTLNLETAGGYGAGIGGDAGKTAGTITVDDGIYNIVSCAGGAAIGGGSNSGAESITINGGVFNIDMPLTGEGWSSNMTTSGAAIGSGNASSKSDTRIVINGGEIIGKTAIIAPVVGQARQSSTNCTITVNGGKLNLEATTGTGSVANDTAPLGSGNSCTKPVTITINGGQVISTAYSNGAAIGSGANTNGGTIHIFGGTVTAVSKNHGAAIGAGYYGEKGSVRISGGTVKAASDTCVFGSDTEEETLVNDDSDAVFKVEVPAPGVKSVWIDGKDWKVSANHPEDDNLYLYLTAGEEGHLLAVETEDGVTEYRAVVTPQGTVTLEKVCHHENVTVEVVPATTEADGVIKEICDACGEVVSESVIVRIGGMELSETVYTYNGEVQKPSVTVKDAEEAVIPEEYYDVTYSEGCVEPGTYQVTVDFKGNYSGSLQESFTIKKDEEENNNRILLLNGAVMVAKALEKEDYTEESYAALQEAIRAAEAICAGGEASEEAIQAAIAGLTSATKALVPAAEEENKSLSEQLQEVRQELEEKKEELAVARNEVTRLNGELEKALETAEKYREKYEAEQQKASELAVELAAAQAKLETIKEEGGVVDQLQKRIEALESQIETANENAARYYDLLEKANERVDALNEELAAEREKVTALTAEKAVLESQKADLSKQLADAQAEADRVQKELDAAKGDLDTTKDELDATKEELDAAKGELDTTRGELEAARNELEATRKELETARKELEEQLQEVRQELEEKKEALSASQSEVTRLTGELDTAQKATDHYKTQYEAEQKKADDLTAELAAAKAQLETMKEEGGVVDQLQKRIDALESQLEAASENSAKFYGLLEKANENVTALNSQLASEKDKVTALTAEKATLESQKADLDKKLAETQAESDRVKEESDRVQAELDAVKKELDTTKEELDAAKKELDAAKKENEKPVLKTGDTVTVKGISYRVTDAEKKEAEAYGVSSKSVKSLSVAASVEINGEVCKVTAVADKAFAGLKKLKKAVIGANVTKIGKSAFKGDSSLKSIILKTKKLKTVGKGALKGIAGKAVIKVPKAKKAAYTKCLKGKGQKKTVKIK